MAFIKYTPSIEYFGRPTALSPRLFLSFFLPLQLTLLTPGEIKQTPLPGSVAIGHAV